MTDPFGGWASGNIVCVHLTWSMLRSSLLHIARFRTERLTHILWICLHIDRLRKSVALLSMLQQNQHRTSHSTQMKKCLSSINNVFMNECKKLSSFIRMWRTTKWHLQKKNKNYEGNGVTEAKGKGKLDSIPFLSPSLSHSRTLSPHDFWFFRCIIFRP